MSVQDPAHVALALEWYEAGMDFADALHLASNLELEGFATFEKNIRKNTAKLDIPHPILLLPVR